MFQTIGEFLNISQAADLPKAEAASSAQARCTKSNAACGEAQVGIYQDPLLQGIPCTSQLEVLGAIADAIRCIQYEVTLLGITIVIVIHGRP